ncbi:MAG: hypothetical protein AB199_03330 [Parcubacteria bacterium C7867-004]|nr:MAG: hypothetical protein AB199_03330 [Parcubacteria bacterium C7867-004]
MRNTFVTNRDGLRVRDDVWNYMTRQRAHEFTTISGSLAVPSREGVVIALVQCDHILPTTFVRSVPKQVGEILVPPAWARHADEIVYISQPNPKQTERPQRHEGGRCASQRQECRCIHAAIETMMTWPFQRRREPVA